MRKRLFLILGVVWALAVLIAVPAVRLSGYYLDTPRDLGGKPQVVKIPAGMGPRKIAQELHDKGIIRTPLAFFALVRLMGEGRRMKYGEYRLSADMSPREVLRILTSGKPFQYRITFPEGLTMVQMAERLEEQGLIGQDEFLEEARSVEFATSLGIPALNVEGYLFPDTYHFPKGLSARSIIRKMVGRFREVYQEVRKTGEKKTRLTEYQTVILASLVEAETNADQERALVAGVFIRRLKKKMRLQCDPTVIYGISEFNGEITKKHLADPHPYNTYVHPGLPPGPIGNPGRAALEAALFPADTKYLYFVAKNDGTHHFSTTYAQHQAAVKKYQR